MRITMDKYYSSMNYRMDYQKKEYIHFGLNEYLSVILNYKYKHFFIKKLR